MPYPKHVYVKPQARYDQATENIIERVRHLDPTISIIHMKGNRVPYPTKSSAVWRWRQRKKNLVLAHRTAPFLTTFASPGKIVERMNVILHLGWQCPLNCKYCYLQTVLPSDQTIYTNLGGLHDQIMVEPLVHRAVLSLWTILSSVNEEQLMKIPHNFHQVANLIRSEFNRERVSNKNEAVDLFDALLWKMGPIIVEILQGGTTLDGEIKARDLRVGRAQLLKYYDRNSVYLPRINPSEYTDLLAIDHLCGHSRLLMNEVARVPDIELSIRTKSGYVDEILTHDGDNRVMIVMNLNTQFVIDRYEEGTASIEDRLQAAKAVQETKGFRLGLAIEPVIKYDGYEKEYVALIKRTLKVLDPKRIEDIVVGCVRYSGRLEARIKRNFPLTDLLDEGQGLLPAPIGDRRRYPIDERVGIYRRIFEECRKHTKVYRRLGAETPECWDQVGLDQAGLLEKSVYQYGR